MTPAQPAQIADALTHDQHLRLKHFLAIPVTLRGSVYLLLRKNIQKKLVGSMHDEDALSLLRALDPDDATDLLQLVYPARQKRLLRDLAENIQKEIGFLLKFDPKTAGGLMSLDYIQVDTEDAVSSIAEKFRTHEHRTGKPPEIIVLRSGRVQGILPAYQLAFARTHEKAKEYMRPIRQIKHHTPDKDLIKLFRAHPHTKVAVLNEEQLLVGILYADDILKVIKEQESASLYNFAGIHEDEEVGDSARVKIRFRYKWLLINLGTAFLAAGTVSLFENTLAKYVLLAVYMPIVAGMGGNAATQTLAVMVRGIALGQISLTNFRSALFAEQLAALANGIMNGLLVFSIVLLFNHDLLVASVLAIAMIANLQVAAFFGTMVPLIMKRLGKDPATSATIFITTATDVLGFLVFLGLATILLR